MKWYFLLQVIPTLHNIVSPLALFTFMGIPLLSIAYVIAYTDKDSNHKFYKIISKFYKALIFVAIFSAIVFVLTPSERTITKILATEYTTNIKGIDKLPENLIKKLNVLFEDK